MKDKKSTGELQGVVPLNTREINQAIMFELRFTDQVGLIKCWRERALLVPVDDDQFLRELIGAIMLIKSKSKDGQDDGNDR